MSKTPEEKRTMKLGLAVGIGVPGLTLAIMIVVTALHANGWIQAVSQILFLGVTVWVLVVFPRWYAKRSRNRNLNR